MRHLIPIVFAVLLALSLPVSAVEIAGTANSSESVESVNVTNQAEGETSFRYQSSTVPVRGDHAQLEGTPNRLVLHGDGTTTYATPSPDFGFAAESQDSSIQTDYRVFAFDAELENLENDEERRNAIVSELELVGERIDTLRQREREIARAHAAGETSEDVVLRTIARNYYEARELQRILDTLADESNGVVDISDSVDEYTTELDVYTGPIRAEIGTSLRGVDESDEETGSNPPVLLESTSDGLVLSMLDGDEYVREATRYDNRDPDQTEQIETMDEARSVGEELYPWAFETTSGTSTYKYESIGLYQVRAASHDQGALEIYLDSGTGSVYHERQTLDVDRIPAEVTDTIENRNVNATLKQTPGVAPATITVTDPESGDPIDATIVIDGTVVGETGSNGELSFVPPTNGFEITVRTAAEPLKETIVPSR